jgi:ATP-dependent Clp protease ATP-binding subunit ClpX
MELDGVEMEFTTDALRAIAKLAILRNTGARGLRAIIETLLLELMYEVPSRTDIKKCVVTKEMVEEHKAPLLTTSSEPRKKKKEETA